MVAFSFKQKNDQSRGYIEQENIDVPAVCLYLSHYKLVRLPEAIEVGESSSCL